MNMSKNDKDKLKGYLPKTLLAKLDKHFGVTVKSQGEICAPGASCGDLPGLQIDGPADGVGSIDDGSRSLEDLHPHHRA